MGFAERKREHIIGRQIRKQSQGSHTLAQRWFEKDLGKTIALNFHTFMYPLKGNAYYSWRYVQTKPDGVTRMEKLPSGFRTASDLRSECPAGTSLGSLLYVAHRQIRAYTFFCERVLQALRETRGKRAIVSSAYS